MMGAAILQTFGRSLRFLFLTGMIRSPYPMCTAQEHASLGAELGTGLSR